MAGLASKAPSTDLLDRVVVTVELIADRRTDEAGAVGFDIAECEAAAAHR